MIVAVNILGHKTIETPTFGHITHRPASVGTWLAATKYAQSIESQFPNQPMVDISCQAVLNGRTLVSELMDKYHSD